MSGFALLCDPLMPEVFPSMLESLRHRGPSQSAIEVGKFKLGTLESGREFYLNASLYRENDVSVLVEGWTEGVRGASASEAESTARLIARDFRSRGVECLKELRGAFVAIVVDERAGSVHALRDPLGLRPAYFWADRERLVMASELKALLVHPSVPRGLDTAVLAHLLTIGLEPSDRSLAAGVRKLPPGHLLSFRPGEGFATRPFKPVAELAVDPSTMSEAETTERVSDALEGGLKTRLREVPSVGLLLSGGIDSYLIGERLVRVVPGRSEAATAGVDGYALSEAQAATDLAARLGMPHRLVSWSPSPDQGSDLSDLLARSVAYTEQPGRYANAPLLLNLLDRWEHRPQAILTGDGADALFGDWQYRGLQRMELLRHLPGRKSMGRLLEFLGPRIGRRGAALALLCQLGLESFRFYVTEVFDYKRVTRLLGRNPGEDVQAHYDALAAEVQGHTLAQRYMFLHLRGSVQGLIDKTEGLANAFGSDVLFPFLTPDMVELANRLPDRLRLRRGWTKPVLRKLACQSLPRELVYTDKMGFAAPRTEWLLTDSSLRPVLDSLGGVNSVVAGFVDRAELRRAVAGLHQTGGGGYQDMIWILLSVEMWCRSLGIR